MKKMCILMLVLLIINCLSGCGFIKNYVDSKIEEYKKEQEEYRFQNDIPLESINAGFDLKTNRLDDSRGEPPFFGFKSDTGTFKKDEIAMDYYYGWRNNVLIQNIQNEPIIMDNDSEYSFYGMGFFMVNQEFFGIKQEKEADLAQNNPELYAFIINNVVFSDFNEIPDYYFINFIPFSDFQNEEYILTFEEIGQDIFGISSYRGIFHYQTRIKFPSKLIDECLKKSENNKSIRFYLVTVPIYYCQELNTYKFNLMYEYKYENGYGTPKTVPSATFIEEALNDPAYSFSVEQDVRVTFDAIVIGDEVGFMKITCKNLHMDILLM